MNLAFGGGLGGLSVGGGGDARGIVTADLVVVVADMGLVGSKIGPA